MKRENFLKLKFVFSIAVAALLFSRSSANAASQTWSGAPTDNTWTNVLNWSGGAAPGGVNAAGSQTDTATFNAALPISGIGGAGNAISNDFQRGIGFLLFDTVNCGAYVFGNSLADNSLEVMNTRNLTINSTVTNPIIFREGLNFRGASSVNYSYFITNNAVSPNATLYIASLTNSANSTTRPFSMILGGSNTGTNTIGRIDDRADVEGAIQVDIFGGGRWIFAGPNDLPQKTSASTVAHLIVDSGTLEVVDPASMGAITVANLQVLNGGTLQIDNVTPNNNGISIFNGATLRMNGSGTVNGVTVGNAASTSATLGTTGSGDVLTIGNTANQPTGGAVDTVLHVSGSGTVVLSQSANYAGRWSVDAGTLRLGNASGLGTGGNLNIAAGGGIDVSPITTGSTTYTLATAALSAGGTGTGAGTTAAAITADATGTFALGTKPILLTYTPTLFTGDSTHPSLYVVQGALSLGGNTFTINNASGTPLGLGTYLLVQQTSGSITSGGGYAVNMTGSGVGAGNVASIQVSGGNLNLVVSAYVPKNLTWTGGNPNTVWDVNTTANWLNGITPVVFNNSDNVTFNAVGATNPAVTLSGTLAPGSVTADTTATNYILTGGGVIAGTSGLTKMGTGTLTVGTTNIYLGATTVSNGTLQVGAVNALPATSDIAVSNTATLDLNGYSDAIGALTGTGTIDNTSNNPAVLSVGNDNNGGIFSGTIKNTASTLGLTKNGNGVETLSRSNSYSGPTVVSAGTLQLGDPYALGAGLSTVTVNSGTLDLNGMNAVIASLGGAGGTVANSGASATTTNSLTVLNGGGTTYNGVISDAAGTSKIQLVVLGTGELRINGNNTYSGGTLVGGTATIGTGVGGALGVGSITLSNGTTLNIHNNGGTSAFVGANVNIPDNSAATINSTQLGNSYGGLVTGSATATNVVTGLGSFGANNIQQYQSFLGTVIVPLGATIRWGTGSTINNGGNNATFDLEGVVETRGGGAVAMGALTGSGSISAPVSAGGIGIYTIGGKGIDSIFSGSINGSNSIIKIGSGTLVLNSGFLTNVSSPDGFTFVTNVVATNLLSYAGVTAISNGVLRLSAPNLLTNSPTITLASSTAVLDASIMGYVSNQFDSDGFTVTNQLLVTNSILEVISGETIGGFGTLRGLLQADVGSTFNVGLPTGVFTVTNTASLSGLVAMRVSTTNTPTCSELVAPTITVNATASLIVTNLGPENGATFQLFNHPVNFTSVTLPTLSGTNSWLNNLTVDGSITLIAPAAPTVSLTPPTISSSVSGGTLNLSWPPDHQGYILQSQTNAAINGLGTNWVNVVGSDAGTNASFPINPANPTVFFRLIFIH